MRVELQLVGVGDVVEELGVEAEAEEEDVVVVEEDVVGEAVVVEDVVAVDNDVIHDFLNDYFK